MKQDYKSLILEMSRFVLVGGTAFIIDFSLMYIFNEFVFRGEFLYISVFIGYVVGLVYNFLLSCKFVFKNGFEKIKNKEIISFIIFTIIGTIGLLLTEIFMHIFIHFGMNYMLAKIITAGIVMFWNYLARKIIIFK